MMPITEERTSRVPNQKDSWNPRAEGLEVRSRRSCDRCGGFLVNDWVVSLKNDGGDVGIVTQRCIQCGEITDPVLLQNRNRWLKGRGGRVRSSTTIEEGSPPASG